MNSSPITILDADLSRPDHGRAVVDLLDQYARDPMGGGTPLPPSTRTNLPRALAARNDAHIILARDTDQWVGLCNCFEGFSTFSCQPLLNIHDVYVHTDFRGRGVARAMLQQVERIALQLGCCKLTLEVLSENQPARQAYLDYGFEPYRLDPATGHAEFWQKKISPSDAQG
jgi:GNAT superfamily N-acetyltransferase